MRTRDLILEMGNSFASGKLRTGLTMLGLVIGIVSVIVMLAAVQGVQNMVLDQMGGGKMGTVSLSMPFAATSDTSTEIIEYIKSNIPAVSGIGINSFSQYKGQYQDKEFDSQLYLQDWELGKNNTMIKAWAGRLPTEEEYVQGSRVFVIGHDDALKLFADDPSQAVGRELKIYGLPFKVIGVGPKNSMIGPSGIMPFETYIKHLEPIASPAYIGTFEVSFPEDADMKQAQEVLKRVMVARFPDVPADGFYTYSYADMLNEVKQFTTIFSVLAMVIASTSLSVGGIGIMNMMLTNVTERTREIGLRKALGAKASNITAQFLGEAIAVCLVGCAVAILLGYAIVAAASAAIPQFFQEAQGFRPAVTGWSVLLSVGVSAGIAVLFGWYPARRASKLDPVEALRFQ